MLKTLKRKIALVAVSVLGASGLAVVAAPSANAASYTGGTIAFSGVRVTKSDGTNRDAVPFATATITIPTTATDFARAAGNDYQTFTLTSAPSAAATIAIANDPSATGVAADVAAAGEDSDRAVMALGATATDTLNIDGEATEFPAASARSILFYIAASTAGTYSGTFEIRDASNDRLTGTWTFTTTGVPSTITATAATTEIVAGGVATVAVSVKDANGLTTQLGSFDSVKATETKNNVVTDTTISDIQLGDGAHSISFTGPGIPGSSSTIKVTPQGTIAALAASTATITENSTVINANAITAAITTSVPADALDATPTNVSGVSVRPGSSKITFGITAPAGHLGKIFRIKGTVGAGTVTGTLAGAAATEAYVDITTDATTGKGTGTFTIGGAALLAGAALTLTQVDATLTPVAGVNKAYTQVAPDFQVAGVSSSPSGDLVAKLGDKTEVTITAADQYDVGLGSGYVVYAYRGATIAGGTYLGAATTGADGTAKYSLEAASTAVSGTAEAYSFRVVSPLGVARDQENLVRITYSATGAITSLSLNDGAGITGAGIAGARTNLTTATAETVLPVINTPITAGAAGVSDITTDRIYTVATATKTGTNAVAADRANAIELVADSNPGNSVVYTGTAGIKFLTTSPTVTAAAWDGGKTTVTVADNTAIWAFSTKVGLNTVTATSGGLSVTRSFWVEADAAEFYNIAVSPATLDLDPGAYSVVTVTVTDAFGNPVDTTGNAVAVAATGSVLLGGFASSSTVDTGSDGTAKVTVIANNTGGTGSVTFTNNLTTGAWAATYVTPTNATAPKKSASVAATVKTVTSTTNPAIEAVKTDVKAVSDTVATLSKAVTTIQSSVTELTSSFSAQIKSLSSAIAKISRAIAALSKKIK